MKRQSMFCEIRNELPGILRPDHQDGHIGRRSVKRDSGNGESIKNVNLAVEQIQKGLFYIVESKIEAQLL
jgi:hypothetical protein